MSLLIVVSLIWAFSFGLIGNTLKPVNPDVVSLCRLTLAAAVFAPFAIRLPGRLALRLAGIGAIQFGVMYHAYNWSFQFLKSHEVALLTVTTPFLVTALNDLQRRRFAPLNAAAAAAAVLGALIVVSRGAPTRTPLAGVALTQLSNLAFAFGQIAYRNVFPAGPTRARVTDAGAFFYCLAGAALVSVPLAAPHAAAAMRALTGGQAVALLYLGTVASGLSFFLWNRGARRTPAGTLAVLNNLKIPLAVLVSFLVFRESANLARLTVGGGLVLAAAAFTLKNRPERTTEDPP